jgi:secreted PhoX family phosphatase
MSMVRRTFLRRSAYAGGALAAMQPLGILGARTAHGQPPPAAAGYGPLVPKGDLALPPEFNYQIVSRQGLPQRDGTPTPGIFDGMGAFPDVGGGLHGNGHRTVLVRNHENRRRAGEIPVAAPPAARYDEDPTYTGGCTRLVVERRAAGRDPATGHQRYEYELVDSFNILGGTDTNCAGGELPWKKWVTCEEVVNRSATGKKHGYVFEIDAMSDVPVPAVPVPQAGRFEHEAVAFSGGILYLTEDHRIMADPVLGYLGACFYRYVPDQRLGHSGSLAESTGVLQALKVRGEFHANMDNRPVGVPFPVEWVTVDEPDHEDDTNNRRDRVPGFTPTRVQAQDKGAAAFDREEGAWVGAGGSSAAGQNVYFDCTEGGPNNLGQIWEYDPGRETITLIFQSPSRAVLENPDNITIVRQTQDVLTCEDSPGEQFIRGVTRDGEIYNFARTITNDTEFCGACFDPDGQTLYVNQQGERLGENEPPQGAPETRAVTYAIYGPWEKRVGANNKNFGNGPGV